MNINMAEQFGKLKAITDETAKYRFGVDRDYLGPVNPSSIVAFRSAVITVNLLVLAEKVPALYLPYKFEPEHLEAVTVYLDEDFEFRNYNSHDKELMGLSVLVGDPAYSYDGTVAGAIEFFKSRNWAFKVFYQAPVD
jgi:hypothetical protein